MWYKLTAKETAEKLNTNINSGLSDDEVIYRLAEFGQNQLTEKKGKSIPSLILDQFNDFMIWVLLVAAVISSLIPGGDKLDALVIFLIVILNAVLGFIQTYRAEAAIQALKELTSPTASALRDSRIVEISAKDIVPGDIILLESGDKISADCRLIDSVNLATQEAALTGESGVVSKTVEPIDEASALGDQKNMVFAGTSIARGRGRAIAVATGDETELGQIAGIVQTSEEKTPLQVELKEAGFTIALAVLTVAFVLFTIGYAKGISGPAIFLAAVSLAVAAIPEGLPAIITVTLALGVQNMAKKNAVVRRLHAVETLGATNYICSDKTGTITLNKMEVKKIYTSEKVFDLKKGKVSGISQIPDEFSMLMTTAALANDAMIGEDGNYIGDSTETALVEAALMSGFSKEELEKQFKRVTEIPFESERKMMTSINQVDKETYILSKGAPEVIVERCSREAKSSKIISLSQKKKENLKTISSDLAAQGYRVLAFAYKETSENYDIKKAEQDLVFVGFIAMIDPPREEVIISLKEAIEAGINISMITGDHASTAKRVAEEIGLLNNKKVLTGAQLEKMTTEELAEVAEDVAVYARVNPVHKVKIVEALKLRGHIVAMTGDGVNDAPALKIADIGIAMGITGTDVSKEASDMVLADDNFATIISAVKEGRVIFDNLKKFINFLLSCNVSEVMTMFFGIMIIPGDQLPLLPIQILWINLVTDGLPALALGMDPPAQGIMKRKPRTDNEDILSKKRIVLISIEGALLTIGALGVFSIANFWFMFRIEKIQTITFAMLVLSQLVHSLNYRFFDKSVFSRFTFKNKILTFAILGSLLLQLLVVYVPFLNPIFKTVPLGILDWLIIIAAIAIVEVIIDRVKVAFA